MEVNAWKIPYFLDCSGLHVDSAFLNDFRYRYISRLTIKLLEEGFDLHEHLLSLRRYHFMERADWADLFIMSLWQHVLHSENLNDSMVFLYC